MSNSTRKILPALMALITAALLVWVKPAWAGSVTFTDNFSPPSALWSNSTGNWTATSGDYFARSPNNNPEAVTILPFDLTSYALQVTVNGLGDGGILVRTNATDTQYVLLVLGGEGYGQGIRGGNAGNSIYWADSNNPSATLGLMTGVFTPGNTYTIKVTAVGDTYSAFVNGTLTSTITDTVGGSNGGVGLYDDQPNTTTGSGFGTPTTFSNFSLQGTTVSGVPDTGTTCSLFGLSLMGLAFLRGLRYPNLSH
jgi:VPDSG-CTERM motif